MKQESIKIKYEIAKKICGEYKICPKYAVSGVTVSVRIDSVQAERTSQLFPTADMFFDVNAKLDEQKKGANQVTLGFNILISTKPSIVKYTIVGVVTLDGPAADIKKKLEPNPKTKIPQILFAVYQDVFNSIYILASILNAPYPPPDLLHPMAEKIQILPYTPPQAETPPETTPKASNVEVQAAPPPTETVAPAATAETPKAEAATAEAPKATA